MAELGISIAAKLIEVISSEIIQEICDMWGYKSDLEDLNKTVTSIKNVLLDAEFKRELTKAERGYIEDLKDVVYDADDLFDEFLTLAELKQIDGNVNKGGKFSEKLRCFFSSKKKKMSQAYKMSCKVKEIKKHLDDIVDRHTKFGFKVDYKPICRRREETCSYLHANDIIGRDKDKETIIDMLLNPSMKQDFCFLTIVGMGGLGKTALAQLVFNDDKIKNEFPDLRLWVCVSDQDGEIFDVKAILCKIVELVTHCKIDGSSTMELVQNRFQDQLRGKKFFLVLDDVWNEDRENWLALKKFLMLGRGGSRIVITTRSETTSAIIGDENAYKLQGLSQEDSWKLFKMSAFSNGCNQENHGELVEIGKKIVAKCHSVPLAIKVVGSLLFGQDI
ncbi:putative disease resistance protein RGA3 [Chenopodium quinoa]|uniref:Uncharacterized protein n=1 Tax=Chenopodium quinoa TaxID=63459 RepID=A0A803MTU0_CHEQI|nr:putative disease resistance protein RGA3 [Chenopodium quinoa]